MIAIKRQRKLKRKRLTMTSCLPDDVIFCTKGCFLSNDVVDEAFPYKGYL